ncbi:MAG: DUF3307 domain-containing protein [Firmicutes bacterium]|nr:DUF3307 domain-containing protein [Bacillota bacterium]
MLMFPFIIIGHFLGDRLFSRRLGAAKRRSLFFLGVHSTLYALVVAAFLYILMYSYFTPWKVLVLFGSHYVIDYWKCYIADIDATIPGRRRHYTLLDQVLHLIMLTIIVFL